LSFKHIKTNIEKLAEIHVDNMFDGTIFKSKGSAEIGLPLLVTYGFSEPGLLKGLSKANTNIPDESPSAPFRQITFG
jgi:hypothetical protein